MTRPAYSLSAILPNFNGKTLLEKNLPSLIRALDNIDSEIIVVDDCSSDNSIAFLEENYPDIKVIINPVNVGFASTCNNGIYAAGKDLLCIVNTDVTFTDDYFSGMLNEFSDDKLFAVKGDIINYAKSFDDVISIDRTGRFYFKRGFIRIDAGNPLTRRTLITEGDSDFVGLGCCFVCERKKMLQLGGFDEIYSPFYWEDSDLTLRALKSGYHILYLPECRVYHQASATIGSYRSNTLRRLVSNRNKFIFSWHHLDSRKFWLSHIPVNLLNLLTRWITLDWKYYAALFWAIHHKINFKRTYHD